MAYTLVPTELIQDGAVTSAKLDTNIAISGTLSVAGVTTLATHLVMGDNDKIKIGTGGDLEIYHDASNSYIANSTGNLYIGDTNGSVHIQAKLNEDSIVAAADGAVTLYYDNAPKLATSSAGVTVTGDITLGDNNPTITFNDSSVTNLSHTILSASDNLRITADANGVDAGSRVEIFDGSTEVARFSAGAVLVTGTISSGAITSSGVVTANAGVVVDNFTLDGTTLALSSGDMTLDVAGDIILDADGGDILFKDAGSLIGFLSMASSNLNLTNNASNGDIIFTGNDGGSSVTALTLDMSNAGRANFNNGIGGTYFEDSVTPLIVRATNTNTAALWGMYAQYRNVSANGAGAGLSLGAETANGTEAEYVYTGAIIEDNTNSAQHGIFVVAPVYAGSRAERLRITSAGSITTTPVAGTAFVINEAGADADFRVESDGNANMLFVDGGNNRVGIGTATPSRTLTIGSSNSGGYLYMDDGSNGAVQIKADTSKVIMEVVTTGFGAFEQFDLRLNEFKIMNSGSNQIANLTGAGLAFNTDTADANRLDDYEEGTWTPVFNNAGSTSYGVQVGTYTKVGNLVTAWFHLDISNRDTSNTIVLGGIPFASINTSENYGSTGGLHCNSWGTSNKPDNALITPGANVVSFYRSGGQTGIYVPTYADINGGNLLGFITYRAN